MDRYLEIIKTAPRTVTCKAFGESLTISRIVVRAIEQWQPAVSDFSRQSDVLGTFGRQENRDVGAQWVDGRTQCLTQTGAALMRKLKEFTVIFKLLARDRLAQYGDVFASPGKRRSEEHT